MTEEIPKKEVRQGRSDGHVRNILIAGLVLAAITYAVFEIFVI